MARIYAVSFQIAASSVVWVEADTPQQARDYVRNRIDPQTLLNAVAESGSVDETAKVSSVKRETDPEIPACVSAIRGVGAHVETTKGSG